MDAGDPGAGEHPSEAFFRGCGIQWSPVEQKLVAGNSDQQAGVVVGTDCRPQLTPGGLVLASGARVAKIIHPRKLQQNVEAAHKSAGGS